MYMYNDNSNSIMAINNSSGGVANINNIITTKIVFNAYTTTTNNNNDNNNNNNCNCNFVI